MTVEELIDGGWLERVDADPEAAGDILAAARAHLSSARAIAESDATGAYQLAYDGARKAIGAHMTLNGLRVAKRKPGAHATTGRYATAAIRRDPEAIESFDRMRRRRNRAEYGVVHLELAEVSEALDLAERIIAAAARAIS